MKPEPTITITPSEYRGWEMEFNEHADGFNAPFFNASKGRQRVQASSPKGLIHEIDNAEKLTAKINPPIKCLYRDYSKWIRINVHTVCGDRFYYSDDKGEQSSEFFRNLESDHRTILMDTPENVSLINEAVKLNNKAAELTRKAEELKKKWEKLTEAEILIALKGGSK